MAIPKNRTLGAGDEGAFALLAGFGDAQNARAGAAGKAGVNYLPVSILEKVAALKVQSSVGGGGGEIAPPDRGGGLYGDQD